MVRGALATVLSLEKDLEVVAEAARADEIVPKALEARPDGLTAAAELGQRLPSCRVAILTTFGRTGYLRRAIEGGAVGFLLKDAPSSELAAAVRRVAAGERVVDPELAMSALSEGPNPLTTREREVLAASLGGASIAEIAAKLYISAGTASNHLSAAIQKLGARNRTEAARLVERKGLL